MSQDYPFTLEQQEAVIGHCLTNKSFFLKCKGKLKPSWFSKDIILSTIFDQLCKSFEKYNEFIQSSEEFKQEDFFQELDVKERTIYFNTIDRCQGRLNQFNLNRLERELTGFLRTSLFKESIEEAARKYKINGMENAYNWTLSKLNDIKQATFIEDKLVMSFKNPELWVRQYEERRKDAISTGCKNLDDALGGGLFRKETCAVMAPVNQGKTMMLITLARNAIVDGRKVLFLIHEGYPEELRVRILASFLAIPMAWVYEWASSDKSVYIKAASNYIDSHLKFIPYIKTGAMFVEDVIDVIKKMHQEEIELTGKGFDLVIDDYPKKLKSKLRLGNKESLYRTEVAEIYDNFNHLSTELDVHCFVAVQTNRTGLKMNNNKLKDSTTLLGMEEIDESFGIAQNLANIITLNRSPEDKSHDIVRLNIGKSRNSEVDVVVHSRTYYRGALLFADKEYIRGDYSKGLRYGFLASYKYDKGTNKEDTNVIHNRLLQIEDPSLILNTEAHDDKQ